MNQPARFRSLYWIGWLIWAVFFVHWLLIQLPESLPFVTWTHGEGVINVTWSYLVSWLVLFLAWPVVFRTSGVKDRLVKMGRGIAAGPALLGAGMRRSPLFFHLLGGVAVSVANRVLHCASGNPRASPGSRVGLRVRRIPCQNVRGLDRPWV